MKKIIYLLFLVSCLGVTACSIKTNKEISKVERVTKELSKEVESDTASEIESTIESTTKAVLGDEIVGDGVIDAETETISQIMIDAFNETLNSDTLIIVTSIYNEVYDTYTLDSEELFEEYCIFDKDMFNRYTLIGHERDVEESQLYLRKDNTFVSYSDNSIYDFKGYEDSGLNMALNIGVFNFEDLLINTNLEALDVENYTYENSNYTAIWLSNNEKGLSATITIIDGYLSDIYILDTINMKQVFINLYGPDRDDNFYTTFKNVMYKQSYLQTDTVHEVINLLDSRLSNMEKEIVDWKSIQANQIELEVYDDTDE